MQQLLLERTSILRHT